MSIMQVTSRLTYRSLMNKTKSDLAHLVLMMCDLKDDDLYTLHPASEWHDDFGSVLWWHVPICEPPYVGEGEGMGERHADGTPTECAALQRTNWLTHWTRLPDTRRMDIAEGTG
jgi:hypothetical protein